MNSWDIIIWDIYQIYWACYYFFIEHIPRPLILHSFLKKFCLQFFWSSIRIWFWFVLMSISKAEVRTTAFSTVNLHKNQHFFSTLTCWCNYGICKVIVYFNFHFSDCILWHSFNMLLWFFDAQSLRGASYPLFPLDLPRSLQLGKTCANVLGNEILNMNKEQGYVCNTWFFGVFSRNKMLT